MDASAPSKKDSISNHQATKKSQSCHNHVEEEEPGSPARVIRYRIKGQRCIAHFLNEDGSRKDKEVQIHQRQHMPYFMEDNLIKMYASKAINIRSSKSEGSGLG
jgi:hypothetical protein